jgi:hypothetical protein
LKTVTPKRIETDATLEKLRELPVGKVPDSANTTAAYVVRSEISEHRDVRIAMA